MPVGLSVCLHKRFVYDSDHDFRQFSSNLEVGSDMKRRLSSMAKFPGSTPPFIPPKPFWGEISNLSQWTAFQRIYLDDKKELSSEN